MSSGTASRSTPEPRPDLRGRKFDKNVLRAGPSNGELEIVTIERAGPCQQLPRRAEAT
jgi:hypothetical protein